jgi:hypothetical protein
MATAKTVRRTSCVISFRAPTLQRPLCCAPRVSCHNQPLRYTIPTLLCTSCVAAHRHSVEPMGSRLRVQRALRIPLRDITLIACFCACTLARACVHPPTAGSYVVSHATTLPMSGRWTISVLSGGQVAHVAVHGMSSAAGSDAAEDGDELVLEGCDITFKDLVG